MGLIDKVGSFQLMIPEGNPGAATVAMPQDTVPFDHGGENEKPFNGTITNATVQTLDSMAEKLGWYEKDIAILKVDVESREVNVMDGGKKFLRSRRVHNIFLEGNVKEGAEEFRRLVATLVGQVILRTKWAHRWARQGRISLRQVAVRNNMPTDWFGRAGALEDGTSLLSATCGGNGQRTFVLITPTAQRLRGIDGQ